MPRTPYAALDHKGELISLHRTKKAAVAAAQRFANRTGKACEVASSDALGRFGGAGDAVPSRRARKNPAATGAVLRFTHKGKRYQVTQERMTYAQAEAEAKRLKASGVDALHIEVPGREYGVAELVGGKVRSNPTRSNPRGGYASEEANDAIGRDMETLRAHVPRGYMGEVKTILAVLHGNDMSLAADSFVKGMKAGDVTYPAFYVDDRAPIKQVTTAWTGKVGKREFLSALKSLQKELGGKGTRSNPKQQSLFGGSHMRGNPRSNPTRPVHVKRLAAARATLDTAFEQAKSRPTAANLAALDRFRGKYAQEYLSVHGKRPEGIDTLADNVGDLLMSELYPGKGSGKGPTIRRNPKETRHAPKFKIGQWVVDADDGGRLGQVEFIGGYDDFIGGYRYKVRELNGPTVYRNGPNLKRARKPSTRSNPGCRDAGGNFIPVPACGGGFKSQIATQTVMHKGKIWTLRESGDSAKSLAATVRQLKAQGYQVHVHAFPMEVGVYTRGRKKAGGSTGTRKAKPKSSGKKKTRRAVRSNPAPSVASIVAKSKREILADMEKGVVPRSVTRFAELHNYVDANTYGGMEAAVEDLDPYEMVELGNAVQDQLDAWLQQRAAGVSKTRSNPVTSHRGVTILWQAGVARYRDPQTGRRVTVGQRQGGIKRARQQIDEALD